MILAAGLGTRMGPISRHLAKPAVPFLGKPMIEHSVNLLRSAGIDEIIVNLHHLPETVRSVLGDGSRLGVSISYSFEDPILGTGGGIGKVRQFFDGSRFTVLNSDVVLETRLDGLYRLHAECSAAATLLLRENPDGRYGNVWIDEEGRVRSIEGVPEGAETSGCRTLMFAGLHVIEPRWFDYAPQEGAFDSIRDVYGPMLAAGERIYGFQMSGSWIDLGSARRLLEATEQYAGENVIPSGAVVPPDCEISKSVLSAGTVLGPEARLRLVLCLGRAQIGAGAKLGNCILCPGAEVSEHAEIEEAVVDGRSLFPLEHMRP